MSDIVSILRTAIRERVPSDLSFTDDTDFRELGIIDSQMFIEVVLTVEDTSNCIFNPEGHDWDSGLSIVKLARAFVAGI